MRCSTTCQTSTFSSRTVKGVSFVSTERSCGSFARKTKEDVIGARDADFFPASLAESYARDDREVMVHAAAIVDKAELVRTSDGSVDWCCTTKLPLFDKAGRAIGVCGITRDVKRMRVDNAAFFSWAPVVDTMLNEYATSLETPVLARKVALSVSQFNRQFRKRFHTTPLAYLSNIRLNVACHLLVTTDWPMSEIALKTGFYDQSHFTKSLRQASRDAAIESIELLHEAFDDYW